jgi:hypothetical protein
MHEEKEHGRRRRACSTSRARIARYRCTKRRNTVEGARQPGGTEVPMHEEKEHGRRRSAASMYAVLP